MLRFVDETINSAINAVDDLSDFNVPSRKDVVTLVNAGMTTYMIAEALDTTEEIILQILGQD